MIPINQVILGGGDPLLGNSMVGNSLDEQLQLIDKIRVRDNLTLSFCLYYKYFIYIDKSNLFTIL